jgi:predicted acylesterase/phospholipase RssA
MRSLLCRTSGLRRCAGVVLGVALAMQGVGCSSPQRTSLTEAQLIEKRAVARAEAAKTFGSAIDRVIARVEREAAAAGGVQHTTLNLLAISGGGDFGAYGAGFLIGWGKIADPKWKRPDFDTVTGVSTGALLAPFAFVGTDEACEFVESFYRTPKPDWMAERGLLFFLPSNPSFMAIKGLERDIRSAVDQKLLDQMAAQADRGKLVVISATDLDLGEQKFWDVALEAQAGAAAKDPSRIQSIMLASSAIPAVFPPVEIDGSLYADGGVTANVFLRLDPRAPNGFLQRWKQKHPGEPFPKVRYWVIINNQLTQVPKTVQAEWPKVLGPSLATAIRSSTLAEVRWLAAEAEYVKATWGIDVEVRVTSIPDDWRPPVPGDFKLETMRSLADLGRLKGADPNSWTLWPQTLMPTVGESANATASQDAKP